MRLVTALCALALGWLGLGAVATAQSLRSFEAGAPTVSDEVVVAGSIDSPEGRYVVIPGRSTRQRRIYQIDACSPQPAPRDVHRRMLGRAYQRCRVVEITQNLECEQCSPHAITFENVWFARNNGRLDLWGAHMSVGLRNIRIVIMPDRFITYDWSWTDPAMVVTEAPLRRRDG